MPKFDAQDIMNTALDIIDRAIDAATAEVERLARVVQGNAAALDTVRTGVGRPLRWRHTEDQIALHVARGQLAALRGVWADVTRAEREKLTESKRKPCADCGLSPAGYDGLCAICAFMMGV